MSKTIYYIGAGASYGKRNENGDVVEGIPVVAEIAREFAAFREFIANAEIPHGDILFQDIYRASSEQVEAEKQRLLSDIDRLLDGVKEVSVSAVASCTQSQKSVPLHIHFKQIVQIWNYKQPMPVMKRLGINFFQH